jgi:hypothetical protein
MPKDRDFKRRVRARMAATGERYTQARAVLRPGQPAGADAVPPWPVPVVRRPASEIVDLRWAGPVRPPPVKEDQFGPRWELTVEAGGPTRTLGRRRLRLGAVAALGEAEGGAAYLALGADLIVPAPPGTDTDGRRPSPEAMAAAMAGAAPVRGHLRALLGARSGFDLDDLDVGHCRERRVIGAPISAANGVVIPVRCGVELWPNGMEAVLLAAVEIDLGDLARPWGREAAGQVWASGKGWAAVGLVLEVQASFAPFEVGAFPPAEPALGSRVSAPSVPASLWTEVGSAFTARTAAAGLARWPLLVASLRDQTTGLRIARNWQPPYGR